MISRSERHLPVLVGFDDRCLSLPSTPFTGRKRRTFHLCSLSYPMDPDVPNALVTKTRHKNGNLEACRMLTERHMWKAPRGISIEYVAKHLDALARRRQEDQPSK